MLEKRVSVFFFRNNLITLFNETLLNAALRKISLFGKHHVIEYEKTKLFLKYLKRVGFREKCADIQQS